VADRFATTLTDDPLPGGRRFQPRHRQGLPLLRAFDGLLSANEAKLEGVPDPEVLTLAAAQDRILVTHDRKTMPRPFGAFLMSGRSSPGVFLVSQHAPIGEIIDALVRIWAVSNIPGP
jgi:hypothetical protein